MGINGLLKGLKSFSRKSSVTEFSGQSLAVDASSWLHRSIYSISEHYVEAYERGKIDQKCIDVSTNYILKRCEELIRYAQIANIVLVMDGKRCPLKAGTNEDREQRRQANLTEARRYKQQGRWKESNEKYKACIKIGQDLTKRVMAKVQKLCQERHLPVHFVWSPYEADAQLVKVCMDRRADAIVTEDSDVLVYLAACHESFPVLYKLDLSNGNCDVFSMDWLLNCSDSPTFPGTQGNKKDKRGFGLEAFLKTMVFRQKVNPGRGVRLFVQACVLSGCDYAPNMLNGVGLATAFKLIRDNSHLSPEDVFKNVLVSLPNKSKRDISIEEYRDILSKSEAVFFYHLVGAIDGKVLPLLNPENNDDQQLTQVKKYFPSLQYFHDLSFLGDDPCLRAILPAKIEISERRRPSVSEIDILDFPPPVPEIQMPKHPPPVSEIKIPLQTNCPDLERASDLECDDLINTYGQHTTFPSTTLTISKQAQKPNPRHNQFAQFAHGAREDVRYAKRHFPKDGTQRKSYLPPRPESKLAVALNISTEPTNAARGPPRQYSDSRPTVKHEWLRPNETNDYLEEVDLDGNSVYNCSDNATSSLPNEDLEGPRKQYSNNYGSRPTVKPGLQENDSGELIPDGTNDDYEETDPEECLADMFPHCETSSMPHEDLESSLEEKNELPPVNHSRSQFHFQRKVSKRYEGKLGNIEAGLDEPPSNPTMNPKAPGEPRCVQSKFFAKKQPARRVTLDSPTLPNGKMIKDDSSRGFFDDEENIDIESPGSLPPVFDYGRSVNPHRKASLDRDSSSDLDEIESPWSNARTQHRKQNIYQENSEAESPWSNSKARYGQQNRELPKYQNAYRQPLGPLEQGFNRQRASFSQESESFISAPIKRPGKGGSCRRQDKPKKQKSLLGYLTIRVDEREDDDF